MSSDRLKIGIIAPPWVPVPPPTYGGTEVVLDALARGLVGRGHRVTLFTTGDSTCPVTRAWHFDQAESQTSLANERSHCEAAYAALAGEEVINDHTLAGASVNHAGTEAVVVRTNHGSFNGQVSGMYRRTGDRFPLVATSQDQASRAPIDLPVTSIIHNGIDIDRYPFNPTGGDYLLCLGRMHPDKGIDRAIRIARQAKLRLVIAARIRYPDEQQHFDEVITPLLGDDVQVLGEVCHDKKVELLGGARALLNPSRWPVPFGVDMIEAMACGTPVLATPKGAAPELVAPGASGYLANTNHDLALAAKAAAHLNRTTCREHVEWRFSMERMARQYEDLYYRVRDRRLIPAAS